MITIENRREPQIEDYADRIALLEALFRRTGQSEFSKSDYTEAQVILSGIPDHILFEIEDNYECNHRYFISCAARMRVADADYSKPREQNTPVVRLMADFLDRKSKRVVQARKELHRRYEYLDPQDQLAFRMALLRSPTRSDQIDGCKYAMERWSGEEYEAVELLWEQAIGEPNYDLWYWTSRLLIRHASEPFVFLNQDRLTCFRPADNVKALYYFLALRLSDHPDFRMQKEKLLMGDYYRIMYHKAPDSFSDDEWLEDFYQAMADLYICNLHPLDNRYLYVVRTPPVFSRRWTKSDEYTPELRALQKNQRNHISLAHRPTVRSMLLYGALMGSRQTAHALLYLHAVEDRMIEEARDCESPERLRWPEGWSWAKVVYMRSKIVNPCVEPLRSYCPEAYRHCFDERIRDLEEWLKPYEEQALKEGFFLEDAQARVPPPDFTPHNRWELFGAPAEPDGAHSALGVYSTDVADLISSMALIPDDEPPF